MQPIADYNAFFEGARQALAESEAIKSELTEERDRRARMEEELADIQADLETSIDRELRSRRAQIARTYDIEISGVQARLEDAKAERRKAKNRGMQERITEETSGLHVENRSIKSKITEDLRSRGLPDYCGGRLFNIIYFPEGAADCGALLAIELLCYVGIPALIILISGITNVWVSVGVFAVVILLLNGIFYRILRTVVYENHDVLSEAVERRAQIRDNSDRIDEIAQDIKNDTNEDIYNLGVYDDEIARIQNELADVRGGRREALAEFDDVTARTITDELTRNAQPRMDELSTMIGETAARVSQLETENRAKTLQITNDYEVYLGERFMNRERIDALEDIINHGTAANISEAKEEYEHMMEG